MAISKLFSDSDRNRMPNIGVPFSRYIDARVLAAGVAEVHNIPAGANIVFFAGTGNFYANVDAAAAVPSGDVTNGSASALNPTMRFCGGHSTIGIIAPATCIVTMEFYS